MKTNYRINLTRFKSSYTNKFMWFWSHYNLSTVIITAFILQFDFRLLYFRYKKNLNLTTIKSPFQKRWYGFGIMIDRQENLSTAMLCYSEQQFLRALRREPERRNIQVFFFSFMILNLMNNHAKNLNFKNSLPISVVKLFQVINSKDGL